MGKSNDIGRALEYKIVNFITQKIRSVELLQNTPNDQYRDGEYYSKLNHALKIKYTKSAEKVFEWLENKFALSQANIIKIRRLTDAEAIRGDVTDIRIYVDNEVTNLSIKHNHRALKHQRPSATPKQCGLGKNTELSKNFKVDYKSVSLDFLQASKKLSPSATLFKELKDINYDFIDDHLYSPMCKLVLELLNKVSSKPVNAQAYFDFLVGNNDFHKIMVFDSVVEIKEFASLPVVTSMQVTQINKSNIGIKFSNNWEIKMRLHTASSRLETVSLKFDTQPVDIKVPTLKIQL